MSEKRTAKRRGGDFLALCLIVAWAGYFFVPAPAWGQSHADACEIRLLAFELDSSFPGDDAIERLIEKSLWWEVRQDMDEPEACANVEVLPRDDTTKGLLGGPIAPSTLSSYAKNSGIRYWVEGTITGVPGALVAWIRLTDYGGSSQASLKIGRKPNSSEKQVMRGAGDSERSAPRSLRGLVVSLGSKRC